MELRHITSQPMLSSPSPRSSSSNRFSTLLRMSPARSPTDIPSSPTSIHSSSSAIFERDIEPLSPPSPHHHSHHHPQNPHRIPRSKTTEYLENSVPSVLDSAAAILATLPPSDSEASDQICVVTPNPKALGNPAWDYPIHPMSGFASPIGSFRSRSPSPTVNSINASSPATGQSLLLGISPPSSSPPAARPAPKIITSSEGDHDHDHQRDADSIATEVKQLTNSTPTSTAYYSINSSERHGDDAPEKVRELGQEIPNKEGALEQSPSLSAIESSPSIPPLATTSVQPATTRSPALTPASPSSLSGSISPTAGASSSKRLSFMSYADLLTSTPTSTLPLSSLTTSWAGGPDPPPHIPSLTNTASGSALIGSSPGSRNGSIRGFNMAFTTPSGTQSIPSSRPTSATFSNPGRSASASHSQPPPLPPNHHHSPHSGLILLEDVSGGEWEREGLGRGLEERLEGVAQASNVGGR